MCFNLKNFLKNNIKYIYSALTALTVLALVFTCVFINSQKFNKEIQGSKYRHEEILLPPAPPPAPEPVYPEQIPGRYNTELPDQKTIYLTFDDGPSDVTGAILDVLKEKNVKATFFALGKNAERNPALLQRIAKEGHKIANHSYSHEYESLYDDTDFFINDVKRAEEIIISIAGEDAFSKVFRFPGGSFEKYKAPKMDILIENDYCFVDWNASNGDAEGHDIPKEKLIANAIESSNGKNTIVLLMHDSHGKTTTAEALPEIIDYFKENGYYFAVFKR